MNQGDPWYVVNDRDAVAATARDLAPLMELLGFPGLPLTSGRFARDHREEPRPLTMAEALARRAAR